jgi:hypothetical protein
MYLLINQALQTLKVLRIDTAGKEEEHEGIIKIHG